MKHTLCLCLLLLLVSCGPGGNSFRMKGTFRDMQAGELYIYNQNGDHARLDTLTVQEGRFRYKGETDEVTPYILVFPNGVEQVIFAGPNEDLEYEATANDLRNYVVNGNEENKLMNKFREETYTQNPSQVTNTARTYIKDNPLSPVAVYLFAYYFAQNEEVSPTELKDLLKVLRPKHPHNHYLLDIERELANAERRQAGQSLPDVTLIRKDRKQEKLWQTAKDYNLIIFWATWMPNGTDFLWRARNATSRQRENGKLRMAAISLDIERYRWEDITRSDSTTSTLQHYCDGQGFESPAIKTLGIDALPFYILTDKNHRVIESGDDANELNEAIKKHISSHP